MDTFSVVYHFVCLKRVPDWLTLIDLILLVLFVMLKLDGFILWPWYYVLIPLYISNAHFILSIGIYDIIRVTFKCSLILGMDKYEQP